MSYSNQPEIAAKKRVLFIVNPFSGTKSKLGVVELIKQEISRQHFDYDIIFTKYAGHAIELSKKAVQEEVDVVVAAGGDGTMNEVASSLIHTTSTLGIIPLGSGNGLARHLKIPLDTAAAIRLINNQRKAVIDSCTMNDKTFFCTAGVGFDAFIGQSFAMQKTRGFHTYVRTTLLEFFRYQPEIYQVKLNGQAIEKRAFLISFANAAQYGNNAFIAPQASLQDGLVDVCLMSPFPRLEAFNLGLKLFNKTLHTSPYLEIIKVTDIQIERSLAAPVHVDGEPMMMEAGISVKVKPASLQVLAG